MPLLVTGPFLPDFLLSSLSIWFIYYTLKNKVFYVFKNNFFYLFIAFCLVCIFSSIRSENMLFSFESSLFYFRIGVFALLISFLIEHDRNTLRYFYYTLIITFSFLIFYAIVEYIFHLNKHPSRISSFFGDELILGSYLSRLLPLITALFFIKPNKTNLEKYLFLIFFSLTFFSIFLSGERAALFYVILFSIIVLFFVRLNLKFYIATIATFIILLFIFISASNTTSKNLINRYKITTIFNLMNVEVQFSESYKITFRAKDDKNFRAKDDKKQSESKNKKFIFFTLGHDTLYKTAFNMFIDKPFLGHGPKLFRVKCSEPKYAAGNNSCMTHPHNFYFQLLAETGVVGFSFILLLFIYVMYLFLKFAYYLYFKKQKIYSNYQICILACLFITIWPIIPNGNFFNNYLMIIYSLPLGFFKNKIKF